MKSFSSVFFSSFFFFAPWPSFTSLSLFHLSLQPPPPPTQQQKKHSQRLPGGVYPLCRDRRGKFPLRRRQAARGLRARRRQTERPLLRRVSDSPQRRGRRRPHRGPGRQGARRGLPRGRAQDRRRLGRGLCQGRREPGCRRLRSPRGLFRCRRHRRRVRAAQASARRVPGRGQGPRRGPEELRCHRGRARGRRGSAGRRHAGLGRLHHALEGADGIGEAGCRAEGHERGDGGGADGAGGFHGRRGGVRAWSWRGGSGGESSSRENSFLKFFKIIFPLFCSRFFVSALSPHRNCFRMPKERERERKRFGPLVKFFCSFFFKNRPTKKNVFFPPLSLTTPSIRGSSSPQTSSPNKTPPAGPTAATAAASWSPA